MAEHPGLRVSGEWEKGGREEETKEVGKRGETPWSSTEGGGTQFPSGAPRLWTGKHTSQTGKQLSFTLAALEPRPLIGTPGRGRDLAFSPPHSVFLLSSLSGSPFPSPSTPPSLLEGCICRVFGELGCLEERVVEWKSGAGVPDLRLTLKSSGRACKGWGFRRGGVEGRGAAGDLRL